jgi:CHAD domain-containing protein
LSRAFKNQLDGFDDLRDTQVVLAEISETIKELPQLRNVQDHLERVERGLLKRLRREIKNLDLKEVIRRIRKTREKLKEQVNDDLAEPIIQSVDDAFLVTRQWHDQIDPSRPATIHRVRIDFKTFRYMVEIVYPLLDGFPEENLKLMNDHQSMMGEIQDLEVIMQTLEDASSFDTSTLSGLEPVSRYYEARHAEAISAYLKNKAMLNNFWRSSPEQPFPWEKTL